MEADGEKVHPGPTVQQKRRENGRTRGGNWKALLLKNVRRVVTGAPSLVASKCIGTTSRTSISSRL